MEKKPGQMDYAVDVRDVWTLYIRHHTHVIYVGLVVCPYRPAEYTGGPFEVRGIVIELDPAFVVNSR